MELFDTGSHYIVQDEDYALWCNRETGFLEAKNGCDICRFSDPICLGIVHGVIGRLQVGNDADCNWLLVIAKQTEVGFLPAGQPIFRIDSVLFVPLSASSPVASLTSTDGISSISVLPDQLEQQLSLDESVREILAANLGKCPKHAYCMPVVSESSQFNSLPVSSNSLSVASGTNTSGVFKRTFNNLLNTSSIDSSTRFRKPESRSARRIVENLDKLFNESPSFYYSPTADITASTWRLCNSPSSAKVQSLVADDRFFWNRHCLSDLLNSSNPLSNRWIIPVIQGFVQFERISLNIPSPSGTPPVGSVFFQNNHSRCNTYTENELNAEKDINSSSAVVYAPLPGIDLCMGIISRRSRHRAGTRYKKRGVDDLGQCANYVETEQILYWPPHWCSYVIVRASVPLFWSQSGIQYRPPPKLEKTPSENAEAFALHFERETVYYRHVNVVNLLHQSSKEEALCNSFTEHILYYNSPSLTYITFDFNEHCRGMRFENVLILTQNTEDVIRGSSFTWIDSDGKICEQSAVFRVNCLDCLDRTNIAQAAICRLVLEIQCGKMGILPPDAALPNELLQLFKILWANNGDAVSRQYAGTNALKGDYTRTGEHGITAMVKDGVNSANRYLLNQFQDNARQQAIDVCLGVISDRPSIGGSFSQSSSSQNLAGAFSAEEAGGISETLESKCENLKILMDDVRKMLLTEEDLYLGSWLLFDCSESAVATDVEFDVILVLTMNTVFLVRLDVEGDPLFYYQLPLSSIASVEFGVVSLNGPNSGGILNFAKKTKKVGGFRLTYRQSTRPEGSESYQAENSALQQRRANSIESFSFFLRPANFRLFSGVLIQVENPSDAQEVLTMITECFRNVTRLSNLPFVIQDLGDQMLKIDRKRVLKIQNHPNKIMWADSSATFAPLTLQSPPPIDSRRNSIVQPAEQIDPVILSAVVNAPKKLFVDTFRQFSNLLRPSPRNSEVSLQNIDVVENSKRESKAKPTASASSASLPVNIGQNTLSLGQPQQLSLEAMRSSHTNRQSIGDEWKQDAVRQMGSCKTRIIQL